MTNEKSFAWKTYLVLLPGLLISTAVTLLYILMGDAQATAYIRELVESGGRLQEHKGWVYEIHYFLNTWVYQVFGVIQIIGVMSYATVQLYRYKNRLNNFFSNVEDKLLKHHWAVLRGIYCLFVYAVFIYVGGYALYIRYSPFVLFLYVVLAGILYYISYHVGNAGYTAESFAKEVERADEELGNVERVRDERGENEFASEYDLSGEMQPGDLQKSYSKILPEFIRVIEEDQIFLQKNLRITDIARLVNSNRTYISQLLREEYQCGFSDFINGKRVEYAMELVRNHPEFKHERIAGECGFAYPSGFSKAFKQHTGMTFREWYRKVSASREGAS